MYLDNQFDPKDNNLSSVWKEYAGIDSHIKLTMRLFINWYTFFVTANAFAGGWLATMIGQSVNIKQVTVAQVLFFIFIFVNLIALIVSIKMLFRLKIFRNRVEVLDYHINTSLNLTYKEYFQFCSPIPIKSYRSAVFFISISLFGIFLAWISAYYFFYFF